MSKFIDRFVLEEILIWNTDDPLARRAVDKEAGAAAVQSSGDSILAD
jgi:hypothetical protein